MSIALTAGSAQIKPAKLCFNGPDASIAHRTTTQLHFQAGKVQKIVANQRRIMEKLLCNRKFGHKALLSVRWPSGLYRA